MLLHNLRITFRHFLRYKVYNSLNILGLAFGITVSLMLTFWLMDEMSFDMFHESKDQIYRLIQGGSADKEAWVGTPAGLAPELYANYPEIERYVRFEPREAVVQFRDKTMNETGILQADSAFFQVFSYPLIKGLKSEVLKDMNSIVLTEKCASKYFGEEDPIDQIILLNDAPYTVTGIVADLPYNTYHQFDFVIRFEKINENFSNYDYMACWGCNNFETFLQLKSHVDPEQFESKVREFRIDLGEDEKEFSGLRLQPLTDIHFEYVRGNQQPVFLKKYVYLYASLALIVLILAIINNINLSVAIAPIRSKEVGLKKIMGAGKTGLIYHFIFETFISTIIAFGFALLLTNLAMPALNYLTGRQIIVDIGNPGLISILAGLICIISIVSGFYPAFILSGYSTVDVVKGSFTGRKKTLFRNVLVIIQFTISIVFIIGSLIFAKQLNYMRNKNLGYNKDQVLNVRLFTNEIKNREDIDVFFSKSDAIKHELSNLSEVQIASNNYFNPAQMSRRHGVTWEGKEKDEYLSMFIITGDKELVSMLDLELVMGAEKVKNYVKGKTDAYIVNEIGFEKLGWDSLDGKFFSIFGEDRPGEIIGICKNFHFRSLHHEIGPCAIILSEYGRQISLKIESEDYSTTLASVKEVYLKVFPNSPFEYYFLDQEFDKLYKTEIRTSKAITYLTIISIIIACMGIFGLSSYMAVQRTKEIGIRKVMGSSVGQIIYMLTSDVLRWVAISFIVAAPVTYYLLNQWIQNFSYKTSLSWWVFVIGAIIVMLIALLTVIFQSIRAAIKNPTEALRYE
ncbi:ABC transporter permease [Bacteroidota bacterium]